jgi:HD-GYP domain-containing protein (c-di-GMP phosphodiesterase class II)
MTGGRPYEQTLTSQEAIEELRRAAGSQFDPNLVELFIERVASAPRPSAASPASDATL